MQDIMIQNVDAIKSSALATEVRKLFREAVSVRHISGVTDSLRTGYIRDVLDDGDCEPFFTTTQEDCSDECTDTNDDNDCEKELPNACSIEDTLNKYSNQSPFKSVAHLLATVKKYEFISLVENAYAQIGNKPFQLKPGKDPVLNEDQIKRSATLFYEFLDNFLEANEVRIDEITDAFNLDTLSEVTGALADDVQEEAERIMSDAIDKNEDVIERIFQRSDFMTKYIEVIKDTTDYPIGVLWIDDKSLKKERIRKNDKLSFKYSVQCDVHRVDPIYFWATEDHRMNEPGRAVFRLTQYTRGELKQWVEKGVTGSQMITDTLNHFIDTNDKGYRVYDAMLFQDHSELHDGMYDVMISRGTFDVEHVKAIGLEIPELYKYESHVPCEVYFAGPNILRVRVMETADDRLGVYTTVFRRKGQSIFGWSLHEFIYPFTKMYSGAIDAIDRSVGKSIGSLIQVDTGVIEDPDKYLKKNEDTGEIELDLSDDVIIEFDSTQAFQSNNFKGVPITIDQLPSDLSKLIPVVDFTWQQLERISGIPSILTSAANVSSALRTNSNFNAAFASSSKGVQSLLREGEIRVLEPSIQNIFDNKAMSGDMGNFLEEVEPEILLSDTLTRELNDDQQLLQGLQTLTPYIGIIPADKMGKLLNTVGRRVYKLDEDLIPGTGLLDTRTTATTPQPV